MRSSRPGNPGLCRREYERDACGFGLIASLDDRPSHRLVLIIAFGFAVNPPTWLAELGVEVHSNDGVRVARTRERGLKITNPRIFAGGDNAVLTFNQQIRMLLS